MGAEGLLVSSHRSCSGWSRSSSGDLRPRQRSRCDAGRRGATGHLTKRAFGRAACSFTTYNAAHRPLSELFVFPPTHAIHMSLRSTSPSYGVGTLGRQGGIRSSFGKLRPLTGSVFSGPIVSQTNTYANSLLPLATLCAPLGLDLPPRTQPHLLPAERRGHVLI